MFGSILDIFSDISMYLINGISAFISFLSTDFGDLFDWLSSKYPNFGSNNIVSTVFNFLLDTLGLADVSFAVFMFGSGLVLFLVLTFVKWLIGIVM